MASDLVIRIVGKDEASATIEKVGKATEGAGKSAASAAGGFDSFFSKIAAVAAGVATGLVAFEALSRGVDLAGKAVAGMFAGLDRADALDELSQKVGVSASKLSEFELAAKTGGLSLDGLGTTIKFLSKNLAEAAGGNEQLAAAFKAFGIDAKSALGDTSGALLKLADGFSEMEDSGNKTALAIALVGRSGAEAIPFLNQGGDAIHRYTEIAQRLGLVITDEVAHAAGNFKDNLDILGFSITGVQTQLAAGMAPVLENVTNSLVDLAQQLGIGDGTLREFGTTIATTVLGAIKGAADGLYGFLQMVYSFGLGPALAAVFGNAFNAVVGMAVAAGKNIAAGLLEGIATIRDDQNWLVRKFFPDVSGTAAKLRAEAAALGDAALEGFASAGQGSDIVVWASHVTQAISGAADSAKQAGTDFRFYEQGAGAAAKGTSTLGRELEGIIPKLGAGGGGGAAGAAKSLSEEMAKVGASLAAQSAIYRLAATGAISLGEADQRAAVAAATLGKGVNDAGAELAQFAIEQAKLNVETDKTTAGLIESNDALELQTAVILDGIAAGESYAAIKERAAIAAIDLATAEKIAAGQSVEVVAAWRDQAIAALSTADANAKAKASLESVSEVEGLRSQIAIWEQVKAGVIDVATAHRLLQVEQEKSKGLTQGQSELVVDLRDHVGDLEETWGKVGDRGVAVGALIGDAFSQTLDGIIAGTLDFGDIWESFTVSLGKQLFDNLWNEKLNFDEGFKLNILDLVSWVGSAFSGGGGSGGGLFSGLLGGGGGGGSGSGLLSGLFGGGGAGIGSSLLAGLLGTSGGLAGLGGIAGLIGGGGENPFSIGLSSLSLANTGAGLLGIGGGAGLAGLLLGEGGGATLASALGPEIGGAIANGIDGIFGGGEGASLLIGNTLGDLANVVGGVGAFVGGGIAGFGLGQGDFSATNILGLVAATASAINFLPVLGQIIYGVVVALAALAGALTDITPTMGTLRRRMTESALTGLPTFAGLEDKYGDITRSKYRFRDNPDLGDQRAKLGSGTVDEIAGFSSVFNTALFGEDKPFNVSKSAQEWTNILTDFFSRMEGESEVVSAEIRKNLLAAFGDMNLTLPKALDQINTFGKISTDPERRNDLGYFHENVDETGNIGIALRGVASVFESELPAGVHVASLALQTFEKDGAKAAGTLSNGMKDALLGISQDAEQFDEIVGKLFEQGFSIDTEEFKNTLADVSASATFIGENLEGVFTAPNMLDGMKSMGAALSQQITSSIQSVGIEKLFDTTRIAESFQPVMALMRGLGEGQFDISTAAGSGDFAAQMAVAIAEGKANLADYIPQLRAIRDAMTEVQEAIDEAFKSTTEEENWIWIGEQLKANTEAAKEFAASLFEAALAAELIKPGSGQDAARELASTGIDSNIRASTTQILGAAAVQGADGQAFASAKTEYETALKGYAVDGLSPDELLKLGPLRAKLDAAGEKLADAMAKSAEEIAKLAPIDRMKALTDRAEGQVSGALGSGVGSMFQELQSGGKDGGPGSMSEAIKAFGESFRNTVQSNVLQGMQEALVQSALLEGALAPLMAKFSAGMTAALEDGVITTAEQGILDQVGKQIADTTESTIAAIEPTIKSLAEIGETVIGETSTKAGDLVVVGGDIQKAGESTKLASDSALTAAEQFGAIEDALGGESGGAASSIAAGMAALQASIGAGAGGSSDAISTGMAKLQEALGAGSGSPESIAAGMELLRGAMQDGAFSESELSKVKNAFGLIQDPAQKAAAGLEALAAALDGLALPGLASGGTIGAKGMAIVGERGPELALALPGGGVQIIPISAASAEHLLGGGMSGFALGGIIKPGGGTVGTTPKSPNPKPLGSDEELPDFSSAIASAIQAGFEAGKDYAESFAKSLEASVESSLADAIVGGFNRRGDIAKEAKGIDDLISKAEKLAAQGTLDATTAAGISAEIAAHTATITAKAAQLQPILAAIRQTEAISESLAGNLDFGSLLKGIALDPTNLDDLGQSITDMVNEAVIDGFVEGMLAKGPLADAIEAATDSLNDAITEALESGDYSGVTAIATEAGASIKTQMELLAPIFEALGLKVGEGAVKGADLVRTALQSAADAAFVPGQGSFKDFALGVREQIYGSIRSGLIDAFIDAAVTQGALGTILTSISGIFEQIGQKQLTMAQANGLLLEQTGLINGVLSDPTFKASFDTTLASIGSIERSLGLSNRIAETAASNANYAAVVAENTVDASKDVCDGACELEKKTFDYGSFAANNFGRTSQFSSEIYVPRGDKGDPETQKLLKQLVAENSRLARANERLAAAVETQPIEATFSIDGAQFATAVVKADRHNARTRRR